MGQGAPGANESTLECRGVHRCLGCVTRALRSIWWRPSGAVVRTLHVRQMLLGVPG
jgi:hypothetical protein